MKRAALERAVARMTFYVRFRLYGCATLNSSYVYQVDTRHLKGRMDKAMISVEIAADIVTIADDVHNER